MTLTELEKKYPCTKELVKALQKALRTATPEQKEIIDRFVNVLYDYLSITPYPSEIVKSIYYALTHGITVKSVTKSLERNLKAMKKKEEVPKPLSKKTIIKEINSIDDLANTLYENCNEEKIRNVLETLFDFIPPNKWDLALHEAKLVYERS